MQLIEAYNETATKQTLYRLMGNYCIPGSPEQVCIADIYDELGREVPVFSPYHTGDGQFLTDLYTFPMIYPQGDQGSQVADALYDFCRRKFEGGSYFHFKSTRVPVDERMMINVTDQAHAVALVRYVLSVANGLIRHIKFYAVGRAPADKGLKFDKVVIYYDRIDRQAIYNHVLAGAIDRHCVFNRSLNGFLHVAGDDNGGYPVGIGQEIAGTSFTKDRTKKVFEELTGLSPDGKDEHTYYQVLNVPYTNAYMDGIYDRVIRSVRPY